MKDERNLGGGTSSQRVARNSALHFMSLGLPALTALFLVPVTVSALGPARFGLLALAWAVAEGSGMFDFGMGRATVRQSLRSDGALAAAVLTRSWDRARRLQEGLAGRGMETGLRVLTNSRNRLSSTCRSRNARSGGSLLMSRSTTSMWCWSRKLLALRHVVQVGFQ